MVDNAAGLPIDRADDADGGRRRYSPAVRRMAQEHNVDLTRVPGTGMGGRVTREDVERFIESAESDGAALSAEILSPVPEGGSQDAAELPLSPVRRLIAQHMVRSATEIPHAWTMVEVDVTGLVRYRQSIRRSSRCGKAWCLPICLSSSMRSREP